MGVTFKPCLKRSQKPKFQCLLLENGQTPEWCEATELVSLGRYLIPNTSVFVRDAKEFTLSQVLEPDAPAKYFFSKKACEGILRRAAKRGKELPTLLKKALDAQCQSVPNDVSCEKIPESNIHPIITGTLCASGAGLSRPAGMASEPDLCVAYAYKHPVYTIQGNSIGRQDKNGPQGNGINENIAFTITATDVGGVAAEFRTGYIVRRLTPMESERLMGFPDFWTKYGNDGKEISDYRRYQLLGNSVATTCVAFVLEGIVDQLSRKVMLDSQS